MKPLATSRNITQGTMTFSTYNFDPTLFHRTGVKTKLMEDQWKKMDFARKYWSLWDEKNKIVRSRTMCERRLDVLVYEHLPTIPRGYFPSRQPHEKCGHDRDGAFGRAGLHPPGRHCTIHIFNEPRAHTLLCVHDTTRVYTLCTYNESGERKTGTAQDGTGVRALKPRRQTL